MIESDLDQPATPSRICVVHLARAANGIAPLRSFLDSYRSHPAGVDHDLLIVFKGFGDSLPADYRALLADVDHERRFVTDRGLDVDVYFEIARLVECDELCFFNSFSQILADNWLAKLHRALNMEAVGLVGASGTWQSHFRGYVDPALMAAAAKHRPRWKRILLRYFPWLRAARDLRRRFRMRDFHPAPNYHIRTNAFMLRSDVARLIVLAPTRTKLDAWKFESGRSGLTRQILAMSKRVLIVDRDGETYDMDDWYASNTFWRAGQENLLVSDNQSRAYDEADDEDRRRLSVYAWGPNADSVTRPRP